VARIVSQSTSKCSRGPEPVVAEVTEPSRRAWSSSISRLIASVGQLDIPPSPSSPTDSGPRQVIRVGRRVAPCRRVRQCAAARAAFRHLWTTSILTMFGARASSRRPGNARPRVVPGAALDATAGQPRAALPPGRRVVAHGEDDGMTHPAIPEACPPGEGTASG